MAKNVKLFVIFSMLVCLAIAEELYLGKYDDIDFKAVINQEDIRKDYIKCLLGQLPCKTPAQDYFKGIVPEAINTQCKKCTEKQKIMYGEAMESFPKMEPELWEEYITYVKSQIS